MTRTRNATGERGEGICPKVQMKPKKTWIRLQGLRSRKRGLGGVQQILDNT